MCIRVRERGTERERLPAPWLDELEPVAMVRAAARVVVVLPVSTALDLDR